jgi:hypothetical protein
MTKTCLPQILNMATYLVLSGDVRLKPLNPGDTGEGKQWTGHASIVVVHITLELQSMSNLS